MAITFDSTTLKYPSITNEERSAVHKKWVFRCNCAKADKATYITALQAKYSPPVTKRVTTDGYVSLQGEGTKGTLAIGSDSYTNCMITDFRVTPSNPAETHYDYFVTIEQHTAG